MSLILEALRKSEAERQLGRPPGLLSPTATPQPARTRAAWMPWLLILLMIMLLVAAGSWWLGRQAAAPDPGAIAAAPAAAPISTSPISTPPVAPPPQTAPVRAQTPRPPTPEPAPRARREDVPARAEPLVEPTPMPLVPAPAAPQATTPSSTSSAATAAASDAAGTQVPQARIEHMPAADRARLPPLKLSVHLYAAEAERRFAIIDGRRVTDSMSLADGLTVKAVVPEGVLLVFEGRTWLLPRP